MAKYYIESVRCDEVTGGMACGPCCGPEVVEAKIKTNGGRSYFMTMAVVEGMPHICESEDSLYETMACLTDDEDEIERMQSSLIFAGEYEELFEEEGCEDYPLYMYLLYIAEAYREEQARYINETTGKWLDEIIIPKTEIEKDLMEDYEEECEEDSDEIDATELMYRKRLTLEADINTPSVFHAMDSNILKEEKKELKILKKECGDGYEIWKNEYIRVQLEKMKDEKFLVCPYIFAGIGQYDAFLIEKEMESFECWIRGNGSAIMGEPRDATEEEKEIYIALHAMV